MRHDFIDRYSRNSSVIHSLPAGVKLIFASATVFAVLLIPHYSWTAFLSVFSVMVMVAAFSRLPFGFLFQRMMMMEPFVIGVSFLALFRDDGILFFLSLVSKSSLALFVMLLLSNTTPFEKILMMLKRVNFPPVLVTILALFYRYVFVLIDESEKMNRARESRMFVRSRKSAWKVRSIMIGELFIRSSERAERIYSAMRARGWS